MAAPNYTEDLTDITLSESITGFTALGGGASGLGTGADLSMQGNLCVDKAVSAAEKGMVYDNGAGISPGANTHIFVWLFLATPGLANTLQNRGLSVAIGTASNAYTQFHVEGSDTYGAAGRVGKCYPIRYVNTANASPPYRTLNGSPGTNPQFFGGLANITATAKGANLGVDAIRHGTGAYITAGDSGTPATFAGFQAQNDAIANRWGILSLVSGVYELQGRFVIGQDNAGTPTLAYFSDSNKTINIVDTPHSLTDFTQLIIDHASTEVYLNTITFNALGTNNPGRFVVNNGSVINLTGCNFNNMGIFTFSSVVTADGCTWRGCKAITANGANLSNSSILTSSVVADASALVWNTAANPGTLTSGMAFSKGTNAHHAIELGLNSPTSITFNNIDFVGFNAANGQNDSTIHVKRTTGTVTINVNGGSGNVSYKSDGATVNVVTGLKTFQFTVSPAIINYEWRLYTITAPGSLAGAVELDGEELASVSSQSYSYSYSTDTYIAVQILPMPANDYEELVYFDTLTNADKSVTLTLKRDNNN